MSAQPTLTLEDLIQIEIETIMFTCAPLSVKAEARKRLNALRERQKAEASHGR